MTIDDRVKLRPTVILDRQELSPRDMAGLRDAGELEIGDPRGRDVELELGGVVVARGRLVQRGGATWFKVRGLTGGKS